MDLEHITPIILAGGRGKRLRPMSSYRRPKPFLTLHSNYNFLQETLIRCAGMAPPIIVCQQIYLPKVERSLRALARYDITPRAIIAEPYGRSTAPAIAAATLALAPYMTFAVMPCDHVIGREGALMHAIEEAGVHVNKHGGFVSVGVKPRSASRRFGYMHKGACFDGSQVCASERFVEKPPQDMARAFVKSGEYLWNTGIFVGRVLDYLQAFQGIDPLYLEHVRAAFENSRSMDMLYELKREHYHRLPVMAVDDAIFEKTAARYVVEHQGFWDDAGTWGAYLKLWLMRFSGMLKR